MSQNGTIGSQISSLHASIQTQTHEDIQETTWPSSRFKIFIIVLWGGELTVEIRVFESEATVKRVDWLKDTAKTKLLEAARAKNREFDVSKIIVFRTRKRYVTHDFLLSSDSTPLSLFPNHLELIPVFRQEGQNYIAPSPEYAVGIHDFEIVCKLGEGGFSRVYLGNSLVSFNNTHCARLARKRETGEIFAMKILKKGMYRKPQLEKAAVHNERNLLVKLKYQMALKLYYAFQSVRAISFCITLIISLLCRMKITI